MNQSRQHENVLQTLPKGSKILHRRLQRGVLRDNAILTDGSNKPTLKEVLDTTTESKDDVCYSSEITGIYDGPFNGIHCDVDGSCNTFEVLTIGIPRDPMNFVSKWQSKLDIPDRCRYICRRWFKICLEKISNRVLSSS